RFNFLQKKSYHGLNCAASLMFLTLGTGFLCPERLRGGFPARLNTSETVSVDCFRRVVVTCCFLGGLVLTVLTRPVLLSRFKLSLYRTSLNTSPGGAATFNG